MTPEETKLSYRVLQIVAGIGMFGTGAGIAALFLLVPSSLF